MCKSEKLQIEIAPVLGQCAVIRRHLREIGGRVGFDEQALSDLVLGVSEAFANAVRHGNSDDGDIVLTTVLARTEEIVVDLYYRGDGFQHHLPDCDEICQMENGGLGRFLMYNVLDDVVYTFQFGFTSLRMVKRCSKFAPGAKQSLTSPV